VTSLPLGVLFLSSSLARADVTDTPFARCQTSDAKTAIEVYASESQTLFWFDVNGVAQDEYDAHVIHKDPQGNFPELNEWLAALGIDRTKTKSVVVLRVENDPESHSPMYPVAKAYDDSDLGILIARPRAAPAFCLPRAY